MKWFEPEKVFAELEEGVRFKEGLGERGLLEQNRMNERFFTGDQWHGAQCGGDRPLVRYNIIKRIGEYKLAATCASPVAVRYRAEGVPQTLAVRRRVAALRDAAKLGDASASSEVEAPSDASASAGARELEAAAEAGAVTAAMSDYFKITAERVGFDALKERVLRGAYIGGTGVLYTYWDERVKTGLYADLSRTKAVTGDIRCEVLDIEQVYFGDPAVEEVQEQPFILIAQEREVSDLRREARRFGKSRAEVMKLGEDATDRMPGAHSHFLGEAPGGEGRKVTVITKFYKEWDIAGRECRVMAVKVCRDGVVREPWDTRLRLYPLAAFGWERRAGCAYGDSEITHLIPNQIAINRMMTASVWAMMLMGMPLMVVNGDVVTQPVTNDPGQIVKVFGTGEDVNSAVRFVQPPAFAGAFMGNVNNLIAHTLTQAGANDAALGDMRPDNAAAIIALREASLMPMQLLQQRFYAFCEEVARIWAECWVRQYGRRMLKVEENGESWYMPFDGERYQELLFSVRVDVGASALWSESQSLRTLDNLFDRGVIDAEQYLARVPRGLIPDVHGLMTQA